jgi:hypothetical protein
MLPGLIIRRAILSYSSDKFIQWDTITASGYKIVFRDYKKVVELQPVGDRKITAIILSLSQQGMGLSTVTTVSTSVRYLLGCHFVYQNVTLAVSLNLLRLMSPLFSSGGSQGSSYLSRLYLQFVT